MAKKKYKVTKTAPQGAVYIQEAHKFYSGEFSYESSYPEITVLKNAGFIVEVKKKPKPDGDKPDGDKPDGDKPDGDKPDGDKPEAGPSKPVEN